MRNKIQKRHQMPHIPVMRIESDLANTRFPEACSMTKCPGTCCRNGVWMDPLDQAKILEHVDVIQRAMDPTQEKRPEKWFDGERPVDPDFPSGRAVGTAATDNGCVFLNAEKRCVLQICATAETGRLKPFYCFVYPITIDEGRLALSEGMDAVCCVEDENGSKTVVDLCSDELTWVLGADGLAEFRKKLKL